MRDDPRDIQWRFKGVQREFSDRFKDYLRKFQGYVKCQVCVQENFNEKFLVLQKCFNEVLFSNYVFTWISSQLPEQKEGLFFKSEQILWV